jgi:hypothetical protein
MKFIDFANKPEWWGCMQHFMAYTWLLMGGIVHRLLERSGGKVPIINDGDLWLPDSDRIVVWLEEKYPQPSMQSSVPPEM